MHAESSERGFTLLEVAVATLVVLATLASVGVLTATTTRASARTDARAVASRLAGQQMELLLALPDRSPAGCPGSAHPLCPGTRTPVPIDAGGLASVGGPYRRSWTVDAGVPTTGSVRLTVLVTHAKQTRVRETVTTYAKTS